MDNRDNRKCYDTKRCFARKGDLCICLSEAYAPGTCPFQKDEREVTKGKYYPYNLNRPDDTSQKTERKYS